MAFHVVIRKITIFTIEKINFKQIEIKKLVEEKENYIPNWKLFIGPYNYEIFIRQLLSYKYLLFRAYDEGFPISQSLFYPRQQIDDIPALRHFVLRYFDKTLNPNNTDLSIFQDKARNRYLETTAELDNLYSKLSR